MKARFVLACAASGLALTAFGAGTASAQGGAGTLSISPGAIVLGDTVTLTATCADPGFAAPAPIESGALALTGEKDGNGVWQLTATTTARPDVAPGPWSAMFQCGEDDVVAQFQTYESSPPYALIHVDEDVIVPGQEVRITARCDHPSFVRSEIVSPVLTAPDFVREKGDSEESWLISTGRISAETQPGTYPISFTCAEGEVTDEFTVVADEKPETRPVAPQVPVKPKGAPETGSLEQAAPAGDDSAGIGGIVTGAGALALLTAGGVGVRAYRRRGQS